MKNYAVFVDSTVLLVLVNSKVAGLPMAKIDTTLPIKTAACPRY
jgi:hypothetical protein